ncbi:MAG: tripartite tricarboxylate transporter substrate-binding protein, partial [Burkholderiales bacterium]
MVTSSSRSAALPNVPTLAEAGIGAIDLSQWVFMLAPVKVPRELIARLNAEVAKVLSSTDAREKLETAGFEPAPNTP